MPVGRMFERPLGTGLGPQLRWEADLPAGVRGFDRFSNVASAELGPEDPTLARQDLHRGVVGRKIFRLANGRSVPIEAEPAQGVLDRIDLVPTRTADVEILVTEHEAPVQIPGEAPIDEERPHIPQVEVSGRARGQP